ncbi:Glyoxylase, beta-lactamase superfamily II [Halobacillus alkaliphilus]|uniref:Glyoxylase, beta-lactamase superfamily II n=1 Tax=Halobacillus alkaliphilus TaxID=396056 RepID=A0A1I2SFW3_9BACI|nr:MBL fold metallo-hydrolase [Halobacillus alkaliphilus]SFG49797.1 Glyoxylase, beta-lactamase superfamily II [Halobacillus alkaliphilus]
MKDRFIPVTSVASGIDQPVAADIHCLPIQVVNVCFVGDLNKPKDWVLIDAGMPKSADDIISAAEDLYGEQAAPKAIILTHGHFDHVGAVEKLVEYWGVPVYAHELEMPYLSGKKDYPEPDTSVDGGMVAKMSRIFPNEGIDLGEHIHPLPADGTIPYMPQWRWIHTPGHTEGHVSLFREKDRSLIVGDAFVTVKQEYLFKVLTQEQELSGPPRYLTTDWKAAWDSVAKLESLHPKVAVTGHGLPMAGAQLNEELAILNQEFDRIAIPEKGKFVDQEKN